MNSFIRPHKLDSVIIYHVNRLTLNLTTSNTIMGAPCTALQKTSLSWQESIDWLLRSIPSHGIDLGKNQ